MSTAPSKRRIVLDSDVFRYLRDDDLRSLRIADFSLRVSAIAFAETWATALRTEEFDLLGKAARRLSLHSNEPVPIEPTIEVYLLEQGGMLPDVADGAQAEDHREGYAQAWAIATAPSLTEAHMRQGEFLVDAVKDARERWQNFCRRWDVRGVEPSARRVLDEAECSELVSVLQHQIEGSFIETGVSTNWVAGLNAFTRMMAYRAILGGSGAAIPPKHDAGDAHQLQHLASGAIMLTGDKAFVRAVDRCGTHQAPWVCTLGQLLSAPPEGEPIGEDVIIRARRFQRIP